MWRFVTDEIGLDDLGLVLILLKRRTIYIWDRRNKTFSMNNKNNLTIHKSSEQFFSDALFPLALTSTETSTDAKQRQRQIAINGLYTFLN